MHERKWKHAKWETLWDSRKWQTVLQQESTSLSLDEKNKKVLFSLLMQSQIFPAAEMIYLQKQACGVFKVSTM